MPGAAALLVMVFVLAMAGELTAAAAVLIVAVIFGAVEVAGHGRVNVEPKHRDRYGLDHVRPRDVPQLDDFRAVRAEMARASIVHDFHCTHNPCRCRPLDDS